MFLELKLDGRKRAEINHGIKFVAEGLRWGLATSKCAAWFVGLQGT